MFLNKVCLSFATTDAIMRRMCACVACRVETRTIVPERLMTVLVVQHPRQILDVALDTTGHRRVIPLKIHRPAPNLARIFLHHTICRIIAQLSYTICDSVFVIQ